LVGLKSSFLSLAVLVLPVLDLLVIPPLITQGAVLVSTLSSRALVPHLVLGPGLWVIAGGLFPDLPLVRTLDLRTVALVVLTVGASWLTLGALRWFWEHWTIELARTRKLQADLVRVTEANVGFQEYSSLVEQQTLRWERDRISREIHDSTGYALTTIKMVFEAAKGLVVKDPDRVLGLMDQGIGLSREALDEVRGALNELRGRTEGPSEGLSLVVRMIRNFEAVTNVKIVHEFSNARQSYGPDINAALYKMVQESLTNAYRHGRASRVDLLIYETDTELRIRITDNGQSAGVVVKGIGFQGMEERVAGLGGVIAFVPGTQGFEITASIPLKGQTGGGSDG